MYMYQVGVVVSMPHKDTAPVPEQYTGCERTGWYSGPMDGSRFLFFVMERNAQRQLFGSHSDKGRNGRPTWMAEQAALMPMV